MNIQEASGYFPDDNTRTCFSTAYAVANGADTGSAEPVNGSEIFLLRKNVIVAIRRVIFRLLAAV